MAVDEPESADDGWGEDESTADLPERELPDMLSADVEEDDFDDFDDDDFDDEFDDDFEEEQDDIYAELGLDSETEEDSDPEAPSKSGDDGK